ncbi:MAG: hypothetical protein NVS3B16_09880 [Vulcanimicrobiaceae bacterium]
MTHSPSPSNDALLLAHLNLDVGDLSRSADFYAEKLGLAVESAETTVTVRWPSFLLVLTLGSPRASDNFHFGFRVAGSRDVDAWVALLRERNVPVVAPPERRGSVYVARVTDPDGYIIEIFAPA